MESGDFGGYMDEAFSKMQGNWDRSMAGESEAHSKDLEFGGPRNYVEHLKSDIARRGVRQPILVGDNVVHEGHHRAVAAMELGLRSVPAMYSGTRR